jgi:hypothetical protein
VALSRRKVSPAAPTTRTSDDEVQGHESPPKVAAAHASIHNHFNHDRHLNRRDIFKQKLFGPRDCLGRTPPPPAAALLCELLQSKPNTPVLEQGYADGATSSH